MDQRIIELANGLLYEDSLLESQFEPFIDFVRRAYDHETALHIQYLVGKPENGRYQLALELYPSLYNYGTPSVRSIMRLANALLHDDSDADLTEAQYAALKRYIGDTIGVSYVKQIDKQVDATDGGFYAEYEIGF